MAGGWLGVGKVGQKVTALQNRFGLSLHSFPGENRPRIAARQETQNFLHVRLCQTICH